MTVAAMFHIGLHFLVPAVFAFTLYRRNFINVWLILMATMIVDVDHLLADPIYDPERCSIGFHPLHSSWAIGAYAFMVFWPKTRLVAIGLLIHMALDYTDCLV